MDEGGEVGEVVGEEGGGVEVPRQVEEAGLPGHLGELPVQRVGVGLLLLSHLVLLDLPSPGDLLLLLVLLFPLKRQLPHLHDLLVHQLAWSSSEEVGEAP